MNVIFSIDRPATVTPAPVPARPDVRGDEREQEVLHLVAAGMSNAEIAERLFLGLETVKSHVRSILAKLDVRNRVQAVIVAFEFGFVAR